MLRDPSQAIPPRQLLALLVPALVLLGALVLWLDTGAGGAQTSADQQALAAMENENEDLRHRLGSLQRANDDLQGRSHRQARSITALESRRDELIERKTRLSKRAAERLRRRRQAYDDLAARYESLTGSAPGDPAAIGQTDASVDPCRVNLARAAAAGLEAPAGWDVRCPGPGLDWQGGTHWGVTCPYDECPEGAGPYVSISNPTYYVVAHELCHAAFGYGVGSGEIAADNCAAEHGADISASPYQ